MISVIEVPEVHIALPANLTRNSKREDQKLADAILNLFNEELTQDNTYCTCMRQFADETNLNFSGITDKLEAEVSHFIQASQKTMHADIRKILDAHLVTSQAAVHEHTNTALQHNENWAELFLEQLLILKGEETFAACEDKEVIFYNEAD